MPALIALIAAIVLLLAFLVLTAREAKTGSRVLAGARDTLDWHVRRITMLVRQVNLVKLFAHMLAIGVERFVHEVAHAVLLGVRASEQALVRATNGLQGRHASPKRLHARNQFAETVSYLKRTVQGGRKKMKVNGSDTSSGEVVE